MNNPPKMRGIIDIPERKTQDEYYVCQFVDSPKTHYITNYNRRHVAINRHFDIDNQYNEEYTIKLPSDYIELMVLIMDTINFEEYNQFQKKLYDLCNKYQNRKTTNQSITFKSYPNFPVSSDVGSDIDSDVDSDVETDTNTSSDDYSISSFDIDMQRTRLQLNMKAQIMKEKRALSKEKELFIKEKELYVKEKELLVKEKEQFAKEKELFAKEKELFTKEKELFTKRITPEDKNNKHSDDTNDTCVNNCRNNNPIIDKDKFEDILERENFRNMSEDTNDIDFENILHPEHKNRNVKYIRDAFARKIPNKSTNEDRNPQDIFTRDIEIFKTFTKESYMKSPELQHIDRQMYRPIRVRTKNSVYMRNYSR